MNDATPYIPEALSTLSLPKVRELARRELISLVGARARKAKRKVAKAARRRNRK